MVTSLATYLNLYLATSIHWTGLYERGHGQCSSAIVSRPGQERRERGPPTSTGNRRRAYKQKGTVEMSHKVKMSS